MYGTGANMSQQELSKSTTPAPLGASPDTIRKSALSLTEVGQQSTTFESPQLAPLASPSRSELGGPRWPEAASLLLDNSISLFAPTPTWHRPKPLSPLSRRRSADPTATGATTGPTFEQHTFTQRHSLGHQPQRLVSPGNSSANIPAPLSSSVPVPVGSEPGHGSHTEIIEVKPTLHPAQDPGSSEQVPHNTMTSQQEHSATIVPDIVSESCGSNETRV